MGTDGPDVLTGTDGRDVVWGGAGHDIIRGRAGNDTICSGTGDDRVDGGPGRDKFITDRGADFITDNAGPTSSSPMTPDTEVYAGLGDDTVRIRNAGHTAVHGWHGDNVLIFTGTSDDYVTSSHGDDVIRLGRGDDMVEPNTYDRYRDFDIVDAGPGTDACAGGIEIVRGCE